MHSLVLVNKYIITIYTNDRSTGTLVIFQHICVLEDNMVPESMLQSPAHASTEPRPPAQGVPPIRSD